MNRPLLVALLLLGLLASTAQARDPAPKEVFDRVVAELTKADPLAEGAPSELLDPPEPTWHALLDICGGERAAPEVAQDRALRLSVALNRVARVTEGEHAEEHWHVWWLALDELDRELPRGPREVLLAQAIPDTEKRKAALRQLADARAVAKRFCSEWNEMSLNAEDTKKYAALRSELKQAGTAAIPYLATLLTVPPQAVFTVMKEERGITARQQVRALWGLDILDARAYLEHVLFHVRGPSFTQCATARGLYSRFTGVEFPAGSDEAAQLAIIDGRRKKRWYIAWEMDHLTRHTLRWARDALESDDPTRQYYAASAPRQLATVVGPVEFDADAPLATRRAQLAALERKALRVCPACIK